MELSIASQDEQPVVGYRNVPTPVAAVPFTRQELAGAFLLPHRWIELIVGQPARIAANLVQRESVGILVALLLLVAVLTAIPYGAVPPIAAWWKIGVVILGSIALCFPSLLVFAQYLGLNVGPSSIVVLTLTMAATTSAFSLGFAPIVWFVDATTNERLTAVVLAALLLMLAFVLGAVQMFRCLVRLGTTNELTGVMFVLWSILLAFIGYRMAAVLNVFAIAAPSLPVLPS